MNYEMSAGHLFCVKLCKSLRKVQPVASAFQKPVVFLGNICKVLFFILFGYTFPLKRTLNLFYSILKCRCSLSLLHVWWVSKDCTCWNLNPYSALGSQSFTQIVPCFAQSFLSDLAVKPTETFVFLVSYTENNGEKIMISWIIRREDLTYKSLAGSYPGTSDTAHVLAHATVVELVYFQRAFVCDPCQESQERRTCNSVLSS